MSRAFIKTFRFRLVVSFVLIAFFIIILRLLFLHIFDSVRLTKIANDSRRSVQFLSSKRGEIFDINGNILASNKTSYILGVDPTFISKKEKYKWRQLAKLLGKSYNEIEDVFLRKKISNKGNVIRWNLLAKDIDIELYRLIKDLKVRGVYGNKKNKRIYPGNELASHVIGYINHESTAVCGIEKACDYYLRGQDGWRETEKDGRRHEILNRRSREINPVNGFSVFLTLDQRIQNSVELEINEIVEKYKPKGVSIIVSKVNDGSILAMANYPTYDLNEFYNLNKYPIENQRNRAITDLLEPGSTFKIVPASGALNEGIIDTSKMINTGIKSVKYKNRNIKLPHDHNFYSELSMEDVVIKSSNKGAAYLGLILGEERLYTYANNFGFGERTNCGLLGEVKGILHQTKYWDGLTISRMPIGHSISATPIQVHYAMSVIANGGLLMKPKLISKVVNEKGERIFSYDSYVKKRVIKKEVADLMSQMLCKVVSKKGTARKAFIEGYNVGGKTGTTQKIINGEYSNNFHIASFTGFFPVNSPEIVITVIVDEAKLKGKVAYGGSVAAPSFKNIAKDCIRFLKIRPYDNSSEYIVSK